jgi:hypothetical protein
MVAATELIRWLSPEERQKARDHQIANQTLLKHLISYPPLFDLYRSAEEIAKKVTGKSLEIFAVPPYLARHGGALTFSPVSNTYQIHINSELSDTQATLALIKELTSVRQLSKARDI